MKGVIFLKSWRMYQSGERAAFDADLAATLIAGGVAVDAEALEAAEAAAAEAAAAEAAKQDAAKPRGGAKG